MGTFDMQMRDLQTLTDMNEKHNYARLFTIITASGIICIPIIGVVMDTYGFPVTAIMIIISGVLWGSCSLVPSPYTLLLSFIFYSFYRTTFFIFIFGYLADTFGYKYYGLLSGIIFLCGGCIGMLQYPLATYALGTCHQNRKNDNEVGNIKDYACYQGQWHQVHAVMVIMILSTLYFSYQDQVRRSIIAEHIRSLEIIRNRIAANKAISSNNSRVVRSPQWK